MEKYKIKDQLRIEILQSEKLRALLLSVVSVFAIILLFIVYIIFRNDLEKYLIRTEFIYIIIFIMFIFFLREIFVVRYIQKKLESGEDVSDRVRYLTNFIEISVPSVILFSIGLFLRTSDVLVSPVIFLYFIFIILSTLSLEFKISAGIGITAAIEYLLIFIVLSKSFDNPAENIVFKSLLFHIGKANILIVGGVVSGFVAEQIKKRIISVNSTLMERNRIISMFSQQVSSSIVDYLLESDEEIRADRKYVCVMFLDIRKFSQFAENKQPEEIIKFQNNIFGFMIEIINKHNGIINQFLGDGYMATFGAPLSSGNDSQNAVNASLEILDKLDERNVNGTHDKVNIGIGLHSGFVVAGNVGTETRKQYSISGNTVILASRIEQLNKKFNSQLLISKEVLKNIQIAPSIDLINHGEISIKGREKPLEIYQIK